MNEGDARQPTVSCWKVGRGGEMEKRE
jgi:hypothetical protein